MLKCSSGISIVSPTANLSKAASSRSRSATVGVFRGGNPNSTIRSSLAVLRSSWLDAAKLADAWFIVDRTDGEGSATAELLLEHALERLPNVAQRPTIIAIDSLERLGNAREMCERDGRKLVTRSHKMLRQLSLLYNDEDGAKQEPPPP